MRFAPKMAVFLTVALAAPIVSSAALPAATKQTISIVAPSSIVLPGSITIRGKVTNAKPGQGVILREGTLKRIRAKTKLDAHLAYTFTVKPGYPGIEYFRTVSPAGVVSHFVTVVVQRWIFVSDLKPAVSGDPADCSAAIVIGGKSFAHACTIAAATGTATHVVWGTKGGCSKFQGTLGVTDASASDANAQLSVTAGSTLLYQHTYGIGASTFVTLSLAHRNPLTFDALQLTPASGTVNVGLGNARILCRW